MAERTPASSEVSGLLVSTATEGDGVFDERYGAARKDAPNILLQFIFLCLVGVSTALLALGVEVAILGLTALRDRLVLSWGNFALSYLSWVIWGVLLSMTATLIPKYIDDNAIGSGLPQMKSILSGFVINRYLSLRTLISKALGLSAALAAGLSIGKEGPMVHLGSCVANVLCSHTQIFRPFKNDQQTYFNMLSAAVAVGVVSTFGAPVGGVLFSIEVTATYYMVSNLPMAMISAVSACLAFRLFHQLEDEEEIVLDLFQPTHFEQITLDETIFAYALLGIMSGFVGGSFLRFVKCVAVFRRTHPALKGRRFMNCAMTGFITALVTFQFDILRCGSAEMINALFSHEQFDWQVCGGPHRFGGSVFLNLLLFLVYKIVFTAVSITLPIPCGVFGPVFVIGAALGRFTGETFGMIFPALAAKHTAGAFAVVGAAAVSGAVTRTISTAVIVFELTTQLSHILPVLVAVLLAYAVANLMSPSIYEVMMILNGLPYMPHLASRHDVVDLRATDVLQKCDDYLIYNASTYRDAVRLLRNTDLPRYVSIPIIKSTEQTVLVGTVQRGALQKAVENFLKTSVDWNQFEHEPAVSSPTQLLRSGLAAIKKKGTPRRAYSRVSAETASGPLPTAGGTGAGGGSGAAGGINQRVGAGGTAAAAHSSASSSSAASSSSSRERVEGALDAVLQYRDMELESASSASHATTLGNVQPVAVDTAPFTLLDTVSFSRVHYYFTMLGACVVMQYGQASRWGLQNAALTKNVVLVGLSHAFVTGSDGMLCGVLTKDSLVKRITSNATVVPRAGVASETRAQQT
jgi:chloride channel 2